MTIGNPPVQTVPTTPKKQALAEAIIYAKGTIFCRAAFNAPGRSADDSG